MLLSAKSISKVRYVSFSGQSGWKLTVVSLTFIAKMEYQLDVVAILIVSRARIIIPSAWIKGLSFNNIFIGGFPKYEDQVIFYSTNPTKQPNFQLPLRSETIFNHQEGCYQARILRGFG